MEKTKRFNFKYKTAVHLLLFFINKANFESFKLLIDVDPVKFYDDFLMTKSYQKKCALKLTTFVENGLIFFQKLKAKAILHHIKNKVSTKKEN